MKTIKIAELVSNGEATLQTGPFGTQLKASDYVSKGIPVINVRNVGFGNIRDADLEFLDERMSEKLALHQLDIGDIVFGRKGAVERHAFISEKHRGWIQGSDCLRLRIKSQRIDNQFVSHYFRTQAHQDWMKAVCSFGATMASLNQDIVKLINIPLPSMETQQKVSAILSAYDNLIENNKRRIALLEKMAEEIYREWFVRFRFPGWQEAEFEKGFPKNWKQVSLGKIAHIDMGQSPKSEFYNSNGEGLPFHQGVGTFGNRYPNVEVYCSEPGKVAKKGDVLFSVRAPVGRINIAQESVCIGRGLAAIHHKLDHQSYLYYLLKITFSREDIIGNGAIFNAVGKKELAEFKVFSPEEAVVEGFEKQAKIIDEQIYTLLQQNKFLELSMNRLLSRLISGKLSVENLDIQFPPSMQPSESDQAA